MAQVATQAPANLMEMMSSASPMLWDIAHSQVNQQRRGNELNMAQAQQDMDFEKQKQPFSLSRLGLENQTLEAQLPGHRAISSQQQDKAGISHNTLGMQQRAALSELSKKISDNDLSEAENAVKTALTHPSAAVRQQANQMWEQLSHVKELRERSKAAQLLEETRAGNQQALMQQQIDAGRFRRNDKSNLSIATRIDMENDPAKKQAALIDAATQAQAQGDMEAAQYYVQRAQALDNAVKLQRNAAPKAGTIDLPGTAPGVAVNPTPSAMPSNTPAAPQGKAQPKTQAEYDALPSGAIYVDTDGQTKRKK